MTTDTITPSLTPDEVCTILNVEMEDLMTLVTVGLIEADRVSDLIRFTYSQVCDFIEKAT